MQPGFKFHRYRQSESPTNPVFAGSSGLFSFWADIAPLREVLSGRLRSSEDGVGDGGGRDGAGHAERRERATRQGALSADVLHREHDRHDGDDDRHGDSDEDHDSHHHSSTVAEGPRRRAGCRSDTSRPRRYQAARSLRPRPPNVGPRPTPPRQGHHGRRTTAPTRHPAGGPP